MKKYIYITTLLLLSTITSTQCMDFKQLLTWKNALSVASCALMTDGVLKVYKTYKYSLTNEELSKKYTILIIPGMPDSEAIRKIMQERK